MRAGLAEFPSEDSPETLLEQDLLQRLAAGQDVEQVAAFLEQTRYFCSGEPTGWD
ncbi:MAG: hypothetical protein HQL95_06095 [Magnetococcales bacterium]|nr:hypothetical protein [Magnetococcales bacterium]